MCRLDTAIGQLFGAVATAADRQYAGGAADLRGDLRAAAAVLEDDRATLVVDPAIAPLHQRDDRGEEVHALLGQAVALAGPLPRLAVVLAHEQTGVDELAQPGGGDGLADARALGEGVEAGGAVEGLAQQQERGAGAHDVQRTGDRAVPGLPAAAGLELAGESKARRLHGAQSS